MADNPTICSKCQTPVEAGTRFCGSCGSPVVAAGAQAKPAPMARTMLGLDAAAVAAATSAAAAAAAERARAAAAAAAQPSAAVAAAPAQPTAATHQAPAAKLPAKTMLGMSAAGIPGAGAAATGAPVAAAAAPSPVAPAAAANADFAARTMLGMSAAGSSPAPANPPAAAPGGMHENLPKRTMLGGGLGGFVAPAAAAEPKPAPGGVAAGGGGRTMLGVPLATSPSVPPQGSAETAPAAQRGFDAFEASDEPSASRSSRDQTDPSLMLPGRSARPPWLFVAVGVLAIAVLAFVALRMRGGSHSDVSAKIVTIDTGEALLFEVPSAPAGSKIRFGGQEKPLTAGRATFALAADSLRVGDNVVLADVVYPKGESEPARITLAVNYRIWVDTAALREDKSSIDVIVTALPGTKVTLDGQDVKLDAEGRATRTYPLDVSSDAKGGVVDHVVHYRVQPPSGETIVDELHTQIPVAMMQIDRPGRAVVTARESIEVAGAVGKDTHVSIDGTSVPIKDGRFLYRFPLPKPDTYKPRVVASAAGKAPMGISLEIRRVSSLEEAAEEFVADRSLSFAKIAPNPAIYRGQKISLEGRVYATDPHGADSVIQMFARPCPSTQRCSVWVIDPAATEVSVDSWIRVLGTVEGEQQFRSEKNDIVTVPKLRASFVLPAKP